MSGQLNNAAGKMAKLGGEIKSIGVGLSAAVTVPLVGAAAAGVKMAVDLDKAMRNIQSVGRQTEEELSSLSDTFIDMSTDITKTTDSAQNLAEAFYDIQGSGFEGADAMTVLEAATKAASAGLTETSTAAEGITAVINSYGLAAEDATNISDLMFRTVDRGVGSFEELTGSMSNVVSTASSVGVGFDEVSAAMATMSKQGLSFSEASVSLNQAMLAFLKPTEDMSKAINELGYTSGQAMIDALGFGGAMEALAQHTGGSTEAMAALFGNVRGLRAALSLTGEGASIFAEDLAAMANATGATAESFAIQAQSFDAQMKNFKNTLSALLIEVGQVVLPVLNAFLQNVLIPMIQAFRNLPEPLQKIIIGFAALAAALGPLLVIVGTIMTSWATVAPLLSTIGTALAALNPVIFAVIAALAALKIAWDRDVLGLRTKIQEIPSVWRANFEMLQDIVRQGTLKIIEHLSNFTKRIQEQGLGKVFFELGKSILQGLINGIKSMASGLFEQVTGISDNISKAVKDAFKIRSPSQVMMKLGEQVVAGFHEGISSMGGIGVTVPNTAGGNMPVIGAGAGGGGNVYIQNLHTHGSPQEQVDQVMREIGKRAKRKGAKGNR